MEEVRIVPRRTESGEYAFESHDAEQLFRRGTMLERGGNCRSAVHYYDRLAKYFVASSYVAPALYNAGLCLSKTRHYEGAAERFEQLLERFPEAADVKDAQLQLLSLYLRLKQDDSALKLANRALSDANLSVDDRLEAMAARARALYGLEQYGEAERQAQGVLQYYESMPQDSGVTRIDAVASANFLLAQVLAARAALVSVDASTRFEQRQALERRANLILEAQKEYLRTIQRANPYWAVAAGYQIGRMYEAVWTELSEAPMPSDIQATDQKVYRDELKALIRPLVQHAVRYWELTLRMIERTGVRSEWTLRVRRDLNRVRERLMELVGPALEEPSTPSQELP
ncbi:MAG: hypothetical protein H6715_01170 [Myxococcales bacterium]|nr:hypothetical protein [Myxococcales bacterium]